jgi:cation:H+ antiporter
MGVVVALTVPWVVVRASGFVSALPVSGVIAVSGVAVIGAAFVLTWGAETAAVDGPRSFALAVLVRRRANLSVVVARARE